MSNLRCQQHESCWRLTPTCHHASVDALWGCRACKRQIVKLHPYLGVQP